MDLASSSITSGAASGSKKKGARSSAKRGAQKPAEDITEEDAQQYPEEYQEGADILVIYKGKWLPAKVVKSEIAQDPEDNNKKLRAYLIHYPKWGKKYDEWVMADSMMEKNPENEKKAELENREFDATQPQTEKKGKKTVGSKQQRLTSIEKSEGSSVPPPDTVERKTPSTKKQMSKKRGAAGVTDTEPSTPSARGSSLKKEEIEEPMPTPAASSAAGESESVGSEALAEDNGLDDIQVVPRDEEEYQLLKSHYNAYDPTDPRSTSVTDTAYAEVHASLGFVSDADIANRTVNERREACLRALHRIAYIKYAERCKTLDSAIFRVKLPQNLKRVMAEHYIHLTINDKVLKPVSGDNSIKKIMEKYKDHAQQNPWPYYWQLARLAEADSIVENFPKMITAVNTRLEMPLYAPSGKRKRDLTAECGFVHLTRAILIMAEFFNLDGKRLDVSFAKPLAEIYNDMLKFIDEKILPEANIGDDMYKDMDDEHLKKIKFYSFTKDVPEDTLKHFHFLSDAFFDELTQKPITDDEVLTLSWKAIDKAQDNLAMDSADGSAV